MHSQDQPSAAQGTPQTILGIERRLAHVLQAIPDALSPDTHSALPQCFWGFMS